jgi:hypothetical protein
MKIKARKVKGEGWDVFDSSGSTDGSMQICKIDDPGATLAIDNDPRLKRNPNAEVIEAFGSDDEAMLHVIALAKRGDQEAIDALWLCLDHDGLLNRVLWRMADPSIKSIAYPDGYYEKWGHLYEENA